MEFAAHESRGTDRVADPLDATTVSPLTPAREDLRLTRTTAETAASSATCKAKVTTSLESFGLVPAHAGDHKLIHALLRTVYQAPSYEDFVTWLDDPTYEPVDRLLLKQGGSIIAHVQVLDRLAWFHGIKLAIGGVQDLVTLPEFREAGCEQRLLAAAEQTLRERQAIVAFARTERPELFRAAGWCEVLDERSTEANVNDVLAHLGSPAASGRPRPRSLHIRLWRHVEFDALRPVYSQVAQRAWGAIERSEPYWRWLIGRKAHDGLIVAVHGDDDWEQLDQPANIVGYAVMRGAQVVELCCLKGFANAGQRLLARACQDAIEQDHRTLVLRLPAGDRLHQLMLASGGHWCTDCRASGGATMIKLLDPVRWVEAIYPLLIARAKSAGIARPFHVTFHAGQQVYRLELTRRSGKFSSEVDQPTDVQCPPDVLAALLVGNLDVLPARDAEQMTIHDDATARRLAALFPAETYWHSPLDLLRF
jgi:GNAT superfamily N-acetyltransferase